MKKRSVIFCCILTIAVHAYALTDNEISMFKKLQKKWEQKEEKLLKQRSRLKASDPRYTEFTKEIIKAGYWTDYYKEAQIDKSTTWYIITNTIVWSAQDLQETASIMWTNSENLLEKAYTGKWTDLLKDTADSLMRQKIRKMMRSILQGKTYPEIEDYIFTKFISPQINKSKMDEYAEQSFGRAKEKLKDAYVEEVKRQAKSRSKNELEKYGKEIAGRVGGAVDAAEFTIDMVQKYVMWDDAQSTIENMLAHIQQISKKEKCSHVKAFNIYLGKEKMTETTVNEDSSGDSKKTQDSFETFTSKTFPEYFSCEKVSRGKYTAKDIVGKIPKSWHPPKKSKGNRGGKIIRVDIYQSQKTIGLPANKSERAFVDYYPGTDTIESITIQLPDKKWYRLYSFNKNGKLHIHEKKTPYNEGNKNIDDYYQYRDDGSLAKYIFYKDGEKQYSCEYDRQGRITYFKTYKGGKEYGAIVHQFTNDKITESSFFKNGKLYQNVKRGQ